MKQALLRLIDQMGYDAITIQQLADAADVARSTFYAHYASKDDLLFDGFGEWLLSFGEPGCAVGPDGGLRFRFVLPLLRHARSQAEFFDRTIVRGDDARLRWRLGVVVGEAAAREAGWETERGSAGEARSRAVAGALIGLLRWWFEEGVGWTPEEVDRAFHEAVGMGTSSPA